MKKAVCIQSTVCLIILFLIATQSTALMEALSTAELTRASELIVQGKVKKVESLWSDDEKIIFTRATVLLDHILRGACLQKQITVEFLGGKVGDIGMGVSDGPRLIQGEKVVLFLNPDTSFKGNHPVTVYKIYGASQGKYTINNNGIAHKGGFSLLGEQAALKVIDTNIPLDKLIQKIKNID